MVHGARGRARELRWLPPLVTRSSVSIRRIDLGMLHGDVSLQQCDSPSNLF